MGKIIVCQDWKSTSGNHAGMLHLFKEVVKRNPKHKLFVVNKGYKNKTRFIYIIYLTIYICFYAKRDSTVILTEYLHNKSYQHILARFLKIFRPDIKIDALAHWVPSMMLELLGEKRILKDASYVDRIITLGSSLTKFLNGVGVKNVKTSFHYVDLDYYQKTDIRNTTETVNVITIGALDRNFGLLSEIVKSVPDMNFYICKGNKNIDYLFEDCNNVKLIGYVSENELKELMNSSDISLNVMNDTIGSNVITTSLAMGLAIVVSDVGSIRDYCDDTNAIFCRNNKEDFIDVLNKLADDNKKMNEMKSKSIEKSKRLSIEKFMQDISL